jgi:hypothetical protein
MKSSGNGYSLSIQNIGNNRFRSSGSINISSITPSGGSITINGDTIITGSLNLGDVLQDDSNTMILTISGDGNVEWRDVSTISSGAESSSTVEMDVLDASGTVLTSVFCDVRSLGTRKNVIFGAFTTAALVSQAFLQIVIGADCSAYPMLNELTLGIGSVLEACHVVHAYDGGTPANSVLKIYRKNGSTFSGVVDLGVQTIDSIGFMQSISYHQV